MATMKTYLPDLLLLALGLLVMALLIYLGASSQGWVALLCFLALAVVWTGWYRQLLRLAQKILGADPDDSDDQPFFPG